MNHEELWSQMQALYGPHMDVNALNQPESLQTSSSGPHPLVRALGKNLVESLSCFDGILNGPIRTPELRRQAQELYAFLERYARRDVHELAYLHDHITIMALNTFDATLKKMLETTLVPQVRTLIEEQVARLRVLPFRRLFEPLPKLQAQFVSAYETTLLEGGIKLSYLDLCTVLMQFHVRLLPNEAKRLYHRLEQHVARHPGWGDAYFLAIARKRLFSKEAPQTLDYQTLQQKPAFQKFPPVYPLSHDAAQLQSIAEEAEKVNRLLVEEQVKQRVQSEILPLIHELATHPYPH